MSDSNSLTTQNLFDLDNDINKLFISDAILPFNKDDLIDTNTCLGSSQFEIRQYHYKPTDLYMAVKRLPLPRRHRKNDKNPYKDKLIEETKILSQLRHSSDIVEFYGLCFTRDYALLCIELMDMNLSELNRLILKSEMSCPDNMLPHIVVPIIDGIEYCHKKNIIHIDIKPDNILFKRSGKFKVSDFSESCVIDATATGNYNGTILYWSPEKAKDNEVKGPKYDTWCLGMTLLEILCGFHPYEKLLGQNQDVITLKQFIENVDPETLLKCADFEKEHMYNSVITPRAKADVMKLIKCCLKKIDERATIDELKNTSYYKNAQEECKRNENFIKKRFEFYEFSF